MALRDASLMLGAPALQALVGELDTFGWRARERGQHYAAQGRVGPFGVDGSSIHATVRGTDLYDVAWEWDGGQWFPDCTCPVGPDCKHAYALACSVLAHSRTYAGFEHPRLSTLLPANFRAGAPRAGGASVAAVQALQRERQAMPSAIDRLRSAPDVWEREQALFELLSQAPHRAISPYDEPFPSLLAERDIDVRCWLVARAIRSRSDWVPPALIPYERRADLAERHAQRARTALRRELVDWAAAQRSVAARQLRLVLTLGRHASGFTAITAQPRLTAPRLADAPRTLQQLRQLQTESRRTPGLLAPEQVLLLETLVDLNVGGDFTYAASGLSLPSLRRVLSQVAGSPLVSWDTDIAADLLRRSGITPGGPVVMCPDPARLLPACVDDEGGATRLELQFLWPDGRQRSGRDVLHFRNSGVFGVAQPSLVLADGAFSVVVEEPPASVVELFAQAENLPLAGADQVETIALLASRFPHLHATLDKHTRFHATTPVMLLDLRSDDWLQVRLLAQAAGKEWRPDLPLPEGAMVFEYTAEQRWVRRTAPPLQRAGGYEPMLTSALDEGAADPDASEVVEAVPEAPAVDAWIDAPDPDTSNVAIQWLTSLQAAPGDRKGPGRLRPQWEDRGVGWWLFAGRRQMEGLAEAWAARPESVTFYGNDRVRRLLSGTHVVTPHLRLKASGVDWFTVSADWKAEGMQLTDADLVALRAATTHFVKLSSGWVRRDDAALQEDALQVLADLGIEPGGGDQSLSMWQLVGASEDSLQRLEEWSDGAQALETVRRLRQRLAEFTGLPAVTLPATVKAELRPYQHRGVDFLAYTASLGIGAVLADDMGLGKTVQALAWLAALHEQDPDGGPTLVVCPASVVHNWAREAERFTPHFRVALLTRGETRHALRKEIAQHDLVITNYALLRRDVEEWRKVELRVAILDEAQNIKNPDAVVTKSALALNAKHRLALTGTPLENRALDLWSIGNFVNPGYLGPRATFERRYDRLDAPPHARKLLAAKLRPILLRRTKLEVAPELPERIEERRDCEMVKEQRQLYLAELRRSRALVDDVSKKTGGITRNKITILAALTRLRQICCHPALVGGRRGLGSGKFDSLFELLEPLLAEGHKVLLFSQFVECLKLIATAMREREIAHHMLTGATVKRERVVAAFQEDPNPSVFLVSLKAGGTGLNLTAASYVVLFDPWWNPAVEAQAIDRTHRIGQDRTVIAYRLLTLGTIEEKIWELQQRKAALARDVLGEEGFARALTREDLDYLLEEP